MQIRFPSHRLSATKSFEMRMSRKARYIAVCVPTQCLGVSGLWPVMAQRYPDDLGDRSHWCCASPRELFLCAEHCSQLCLCLLLWPTSDSFRPPPHGIIDIHRLHLCRIAIACKAESGAIRVTASSRPTANAWPPHPAQMPIAASIRPTPLRTHSGAITNAQIRQPFR